MGGSVGEGNRTPAAEFNIWADPEAARRVFESGIDVTMIGLDVTHQALVTDADAEALRGARHGREGRRRAPRLLPPLAPATYPDLDGSPLHDPVAVAHVIDPGLVETKPAYIEVDCGWEQGRGRTNVDWRGRLDSHPPNATVGLGIDRERLRQADHGPPRHTRLTRNRALRATHKRSGRPRRRERWASVRGGGGVRGAKWPSMAQARRRRVPPSRGRRRLRA